MHVNCADFVYLASNGGINSGFSLEQQEISLPAKIVNFWSHCRGLPNFTANLLTCFN